MVQSEFPLLLQVWFGKDLLEIHRDNESNDPLTSEDSRYVLFGHLNLLIASSFAIRRDKLYEANLRLRTIQWGQRIFDHGILPIYNRDIR